MLPKEIRDKKAFAKVCARETKRIIKKMDSYLNSSNEKSIEMAEAFYRVLSWHVVEGDLTPGNVNLASLLRRGAHLESMEIKKAEKAEEANAKASG